MDIAVVTCEMCVWAMSGGVGCHSDDDDDAVVMMLGAASCLWTL